MNLVLKSVKCKCKNRWILWNWNYIQYEYAMRIFFCVNTDSVVFAMWTWSRDLDSFVVVLIYIYSFSSHVIYTKSGCSTTLDQMSIIWSRVIEMMPLTSSELLGCFESSPSVVRIRHWFPLCTLVCTVQPRSSYILASSRRSRSCAFTAIYSCSRCMLLRRPAMLNHLTLGYVSKSYVVPHQLVIFTLCRYLYLDYVHSNLKSNNWYSNCCKI